MSQEAFVQGNMQTLKITSLRYEVPHWLLVTLAGGRLVCCCHAFPNALWEASFRGGADTGAHFERRCHAQCPQSNLPFQARCLARLQRLHQQVLLYLCPDIHTCMALLPPPVWLFTPCCIVMTSIRRRKAHQLSLIRHPCASTLYPDFENEREFAMPRRSVGVRILNA